MLCPETVCFCRSLADLRGWEGSRSARALRFFDRALAKGLG